MTKQIEEIKKRPKKSSIFLFGLKPVLLPEGVKATLNGALLQVEGKRGKLSWTIPPLIDGKIEGNVITVMPRRRNGETKAFHGLTRKLVLNMVEGVSVGFKKQLVIEGVGFRAQVAGQKLTMTLGFSHPAIYEIPAGIKITVDGKGQNNLIIEGNDKQMVGQAAAQIRSIKKPEPYKGTGIRYSDEIVKRKAGKAAAGAAGGKK